MLVHVENVIYLAMLQFRELLNSRCDSLIDEPLLVRTLPMLVCSHFDGAIFPKLLFKLDEQLNRVPSHLLLG